MNLFAYEYNTMMSRIEKANEFSYMFPQFSTPCHYYDDDSNRFIESSQHNIIDENNYVRSDIGNVSEEKNSSNELQNIEYNNT